MTCWPGVRLFMTSSPTARSRTRAMKSLTTRKLTSASSSARRTSRSASSTSFSVSLPRPRSLSRADCSFSAKLLNNATPPLLVGLRQRLHQPADGADALDHFPAFLSVHELRHVVGQRRQVLLYLPEDLLAAQKTLHQLELGLKRLQCALGALEDVVHRLAGHVVLRRDP